MKKGQKKPLRASLAAIRKGLRRTPKNHESWQRGLNET